ncbi:unnamed protein product [Merluccius merluccius]
MLMCLHMVVSAAKLKPAGPDVHLSIGSGSGTGVRSVTPGCGAAAGDTAGRVSLLVSGTLGDHLQVHRGRTWVQVDLSSESRRGAEQDHKTLAVPTCLTLPDRYC